MSQLLESEIGAGCEVIKPGWVRINFNYFIPEEEFTYLVDAVHVVAESGWRLLPQYRFDSATGSWRHRQGLAAPPLTLEGFLDPAAADPQREPIERLADYLNEARKILESAPSGGEESSPLPASAESLRWFPLPSEV